MLRKVYSDLQIILLSKAIVFAFFETIAMCRVPFGREDWLRAKMEALSIKIVNA